MNSIKKRLFTLILLCICSCVGNSHALSMRNASLKTPLFQSEENAVVTGDEKTKTNDSTRIVQLLKSAESLVHINDKKAFQLTQKALESAKGIHNLKLIGKAQNALGNLHWFSGDYNRASQFYFDALKTYEQTDSPYEIGICYRNIGWIYLGQKKYDATEKYFNQSLEIMLALNREHEILIGYDDLANLYLTSASYEKGLEYCNKSLEIARKAGADDAIGSTLMTKGTIASKMGNYSLAKITFKESISRLQVDRSSTYNSSLSHYGLAEIYLVEKNYTTALKHIDKSIEYARKGNHLNELANAYYLKASILEALGEKGKALDLMKAYATTKDTLNSKNNSQFIQSMAANFEMKQNEMRIQNLEQKQKLDSAELSKERSFKFFLLIILLLALVLGVMAYRSFLNKKRDNKALSIAYEEIETKNKDISDSISYALNIQQARLPHLDQLKNAFNDCFVIYIPRDTVSGDFFWHNKNEDGTNIFAIADCTGHGIPGAFMSMMGIDGFNYAILEKRIEQPGEILTLVNRFIKESLNQDHNEARSKDGMDVALCTFNPNFTEVQYAGANRPLWIHRNNEILEFKPQKLSIGGNHVVHYNFTEETIPLEKGDMVYLFSDGFADQFGGDKSKKFMSKRLKETLANLGEMKCEEQEQVLLDCFNSWKGQLSQVDDVVLVGIRI